ncbi:MAG: rubrerythrin [Spirochaetota bacterium]
MHVSVKGTQTEQNLLKSFAGESQARTRYDFYASAAKKDGYEKVRLIFEETAMQEMMHAKRFFSYLDRGENLEITAAYPAGVIGSTAENLTEAAMGEHEEHSILYPSFAKVAEEEGFKEIAMLWNFVSNAEKHHEARYNDLRVMVENGTMFERDEPTTWRCLKCGFIVEGKQAPPKCPNCLYPQAWFEELNTNW